MPLSISNPLGHVTCGVVVEVVEDLILLVDGVKETVEELDPFTLILEEFDDLVAIIEVGAQNEAGEVGGCLKVDMHLEADEIHEEFVDLSNPITPIKCVDGEGSSGEGSNGGLSPDDDIEGGGHDVVVVAGEVCDWCRTGFWVV